MFARLGSWCATHRVAVVLAWLAALVSLGTVVGGVGSDIRSEFDLPDLESRQGFNTLEEHFDGLGAGLRGMIVIRSERPVSDPEVQAQLEEFFDSVEEIDRASVLSPFAPGMADHIATSGDAAGRVAYADVELAGEAEQDAMRAFADAVKARAPDLEGVQIDYGGAVFSEFEQPASEMLGLAFAIFILILAFGSVLAMGLPVLVALGGIGVGSLIVMLLSNLMTMPESTSTLGMMIGLGVGIDYALFIVTRYREQLRAGHTAPEAVGIALDTSGRAVLFAGLTVVISLLGMLVMRIGFVSGLAIGAAVTVTLTMLASLTLLPALLGFAGQRLDVTRWRGLLIAACVAVALIGTALKLSVLSMAAVAAAVLTVVVSVLSAVFKFSTPLSREVPTPKEKPLRETYAYRWSRLVQARPWTVAIVSAVLLVGLSLPLFGMRLGFSDDGNLPEDSTNRQGYDVISEAFGPGHNGPLLLAAQLPSGTDPAVLERITEALESTPGVAAVPNGAIANTVAKAALAARTAETPEAQAAALAAIGDAGEPTAALWQVIPTTSPQDQATTELVHHLREDVIPAAVGDSGVKIHITGYVAVTVDFSDYLAQRLPWFFVAVLGMSFLLLMVVFRSLLVPVKAVIMNLLSIGAAYGLTVGVFQWGWARAVPFFGIERGPIEPFMPMMLFAIVFGLSMDYEVFLLSRIREEWVRTGNARESVADGLAATAKVISAAAAIMVFVFGSFMLEIDRTVKLFGFGLAAAVLLDATIVRLLLVPATMELLGDRNWWIPRWLDRILPHVNVEGTDAIIDELIAEELADAAGAHASGPDDGHGDGHDGNREPELV